MLKNWRSWVLLFLFFAPYLAFIGLGFLWLKERGWLWVCVSGLISIAMGVVFTILMARWSKSTHSFLPPIDWNQPQTFAEFDRKAWELVQAEAEHGEALDMVKLTAIDTYVDTGKRLATRLAAHYHPLSNDPIERVPVIELLTALELAAEDLTGLCRQVPGGDLVTMADWKRAVVAANYIQKASDIYTYLLPIFNPVTGISRLASQHLMVKPAWKNMQQNVLRWFHRAFVNRLGTHLVELYSGRLVIGSDQYRKLTRKLSKRNIAVDADSVELTIAFAGAKGSGKSTLLGRIEEARTGAGAMTAGRLAGLGGDEEGLTRLKTATFSEVEAYTTHADKESARDRSTRRHAVNGASQADVVVFTLDARTSIIDADLAFLKAWVQWYTDHPGLQIPPTIVVVTGQGGSTTPDPATDARVQAVESVLPPGITKVVRVDLSASDPSRLIDAVVPPLTVLCHRAERNSLIRFHWNNSTRSKAGRLFRQVGQQGRSLWQGIKDRKGEKTTS